MMPLTITVPKLTERQRLLLRNPSRIVWIGAGSKTGKTVALALWILEGRGGRYIVDVSEPKAGGRKRSGQKFASKREADVKANAIRARLREGLPAFESESVLALAFSVLDALDLYAARPVDADGRPPRSDHH